ncbi:MAG: hypothetical protein K1X74_13790 [Pirellulales bacterium]|nr:hypothetical protein [Pirellulales bacterium]
MTCEHLKQLYRVCQQHDLKLSSSDLIRLVCPHCGVEDVCPSVLTQEFDARHQTDEPAPNEPTDARPAPS